MLSPRQTWVVSTMPAWQEYREPAMRASFRRGKTPGAAGGRTLVMVLNAEECIAFRQCHHGLVQQESIRHACSEGSCISRWHRQLMPSKNLVRTLIAQQARPDRGRSRYRSADERFNVSSKHIPRSDSLPNTLNQSSSMSMPGM